MAQIRPLKRALEKFVRPRRKKEDRVFQKLHDIKLLVQDDRLSASFFSSPNFTER